MKKLRVIIVLMLLVVASVAYAEPLSLQNSKSKNNEYNKFSFRIQAGVNLSNTSDDVFDETHTLIIDDFDEYINVVPSVGYNVGLRLDKQFNRYFAIQTGLDYTFKAVEIFTEYKLDFPSGEYIYCKDEEKYSFHYLQIPLMVGARCDFDCNVPVQLQFNTGPYIAVALAGKHKVDAYFEEKIADGYNPTTGRYTYTTTNASEKYSQNAFGDINDNEKAERIEDEVLGLKRFDIGWRFDVGVDINKFYIGVAYDLGFFDIQNEQVKKEYKKIYGAGNYEPFTTSSASFNVGYRF
ncbi:MAG: PorT family protein [Muribaculaceae bacterium]|nr:PorT family protein [Muribaculaceae bacterium]